MGIISKSLFLCSFFAFASLPFSLVASVAQSSTGLPPGDYSYHPETDSYVPFGGDPKNNKRTGFVEDRSSGPSAGQTDSSYSNFGQDDCENSPGFSKNARQIEQVGWFIKTKIIGKDDRCPLRYGPDSTDADRALYGTGEVLDRDRICQSRSKNKCSGTGHLIGDSTDIVVTSAHVFQYGDKGELMADPRKGFTFTTRVWSPKVKGYVIRRYKVKDYKFGTANPDKYPDLDYAFLRLEEEAGKVVDGLTVPKVYQIKPLPFKLVDEGTKSPNVAMTAGYNADTNDFSKNCAPFSLNTMPSDHPYLVGTINVNPGNLYVHNGDTMGGSSGSAIARLDEKGHPYFAAVHRGWIENTHSGRSESDRGQSSSVNVEIASSSRDGGGDGVNIAIKAGSFYREFMEFSHRVVR